MKKLTVILGLVLVMLLVPLSCAPPALESGALAIQPEITDITITGYHSTHDIEGNYAPDRVEATFNWETKKPCYYYFEVRPVDFDYPSNSGGYEKLDVSAPLQEGVKHSWPIVLKSGKLHLYVLTVWDKEKNYFTKSDTFLAPVVPKAPPPPAPAPTQTPKTTKVTPVPVEPVSGTPGAANDDIVYPPGGFTYRANVHQEGQPDWPAIQQTEVALEALSGTIDIQYRDYIETEAGETRNNIVFLSGKNAPELLDSLQIYYRAVEPPDGITVEQGKQMYGGIGGKDKKSSRVVLKINIASSVKPGEYPFVILLEYEGKDFGSIPCTIKVLE